MFSVINRCNQADNIQSDRIIRSGKYSTWLCQDWQCPSSGYCGKHFGLSKRYATMEEQPANEALLRPTRRGDRCQHFIAATRDYFSESLAEKREFPNVVAIKRNVP